MNKDEILETLRAEQERLPPIQLAELLDRLTDGGLDQATLTFYFKQAFPSIPLRTVIECGAWNRVSDGGLSDEDFSALLRPWLGPKQATIG